MDKLRLLLATGLGTGYLPVAPGTWASAAVAGIYIVLAGTVWRHNAAAMTGVMAAVIAGFGRVIAEVGVAMMLGGNIRNSTRTMTTAIALETSKGEFAFGLALGIVLLSVALIVNLFLNALQQR